MNKLIPFTLLLTSALGLKAQSFPTADQHPEWRLGVTNFGVYEGEDILIRTSGELMICNELWTLAYSIRESSGQTNPIGFYRVEGQRVYFRHDADCVGQVYLLYDFSLAFTDAVWAVAPGDFADLYFDSTYYQIDTVSNVLYGSVWRKRLSTFIAYQHEGYDFPYFYFTDWVEGIGDLTHPFPSEICGDQGLCDGGTFLRCLKTDQGVLFTNNTVSDCSYHYTRLHVNAASTALQPDGSTWAKAFARLEDALAVAETGDTIWVAAGIYLPTSGHDRLASFELKKGVKVYGGFAGHETALNQRNWDEHLCLLSGDIGIPGDSTDNSYHVLTARSTDAETLLDGFTISYGQADSSALAWSYGGGLYIAGTALNEQVQLNIQNCIFRYNTGTYGGAIGCKGPLEQQITPQINACLFEYNRSLANGGAFYRSSDNDPVDTLQFNHCTFQHNEAFGVGGAIYLNSICQPLKLNHCSFDNNFAASSGGAAAIIGYCNRNYLSVDSCQFRENIGDSGGAMFIAYVNTLFAKDTLVVNITNSLFSKNEAPPSVGGALHIGIDRHISYTKIDHCAFSDNHSADRGAAFYMENNDENVGNNEISNSTFIRNDGESLIGGAFVIRGRLDGYTFIENTVSNCLFAENTGGIEFASGRPGGMNSTVTNCTFFNNGQVDVTKGWSPNFDSAYYNYMTVRNCVFQRKSIPGIREHFLNGAVKGQPYNLYGYTISHCIVSAPACDLLGGDEACGEGMLFQTDPLFVDTLGGDFRLRSCSPAINAGDAGIVGALGLTEDLEGNSRWLEALPDMGAYERLSLQVSALVADSISCADASDGAVGLSFQGDTPYSYQWWNGEESGTDTTALAAGEYAFVFTDAGACMDTAILWLDEPLPLSAYGSASPASALDVPDGSIGIDSITGGTGSYTLLWSTGDVDVWQLSTLSAGAYFLTVTDAAGCMAVFDYVVDVVNGVSVEDQASDFRLFPNPASRSLNLLAPASAEMPLSFQLYDLSGRSVLEAGINVKEAVLDISLLESGLYFYEIRANGESLSRGKVMIVP
ncbi:MAG TPA: T9SS type A sorting domain-containing protein [Saprospiraceae bacterium]|nr:T9SS type A sorting domain-containing protein [Saprospiraceae bacterium]HMQ85730.1 T9SS type A sorting domain-containing protein [Saprospiraceae bacterium]